jgi:DNA phosphorothioation-dependent restriction protein DptG
MSDLYDNDFVLWSERQSELLRRLSLLVPIYGLPCKRIA